MSQSVMRSLPVSRRGLLTRPAVRAVALAPQRHRSWRTLAKVADASANTEACHNMTKEQAVVQLKADNEKLKADNLKLKEDIEKLKAEKLKAKAERNKQWAETWAELQYKAQLILAYIDWKWVRQLAGLCTSSQQQAYNDRKYARRLTEALKAEKKKEQLAEKEEIDWSAVLHKAQFGLVVLLMALLYIAVLTFGKIIIAKSYVRL